MNSERVAVSSDSYVHTLFQHRKQWERKPALRALYSHWYSKIQASLAPGSVVELGSGCGNFKEFLPTVIATDFVETPWCDQVVDACQMPFSDASVGNLVAIDVIHHIESPIRFLSEAQRVLLPGGRLILLEPNVCSLWGRFIWQGLHHEPVQMTADLFSRQWDPERPPPHDYANGATCYLLFFKYREALLQSLPMMSLVNAYFFSFIAYPLSGGFKPFRLLPEWAVVPLSRLEDALLRPLHPALTSLRTLVVIERMAQ